MTPPKKIRLTFLWADESVLVQDFRQGTSNRMTDWANEFLADHGFVLDVNPPFDVRRSRSVRWATKYALAKSGGVRPDIDLRERLDQEEEQRKRSLDTQIQTYQRQIDARSKEIDTKRAELAAKESEVVSLEVELISMPSNHPNRPQREAALQNATARRDEIQRALKSLEDRNQKLKDIQEDLWKKYFAIADEMEQREIDGDYDAALRRQMTLKFITDRIGSDQRLNIVFCDFVPQLKGPRPYSGVTRPAIGPILWVPDRQWLWPYSYVAVNLKGQRRTLVHEAVHAASPARDHPKPSQVAASAAKWLSSPLTTRTPGSIFDIRPKSRIDYRRYLRQFAEIEGGYFDGAHNDIMNYTLVDKEPKDYILSNADKELLDHAPFVGP